MKPKKAERKPKWLADVDRYLQRTDAFERAYNCQLDSIVDSRSIRMLRDEYERLRSEGHR